MSSSEFEEIPELFYSFETKEPFQHCLVCNCFLLEDQTYVIEKAIKKYTDYSATDVIFDYAICMQCAINFRKEFSEESLNKIDAYFNHYIKDHLTLGHIDDRLNIDACLNKCLIKGTNQKELVEYQIYAHCKGRHLIKSLPPYLVSNEAIEEIIPLISYETQQLLDGFYNKYFSPDPSILHPIPKDRIVFF